MVSCPCMRPRTYVMNTKAASADPSPPLRLHRLQYLADTSHLSCDCFVRVFLPRISFFVCFSFLMDTWPPSAITTWSHIATSTWWPMTSTTGRNAYHGLAHERCWICFNFLVGFAKMFLREARLQKIVHTHVSRKLFSKN